MLDKIGPGDLAFLILIAIIATGMTITRSVYWIGYWFGKNRKEPW